LEQNFKKRILGAAQNDFHTRLAAFVHVPNQTRIIPNIDGKPGKIKQNKNEGKKCQRKTEEKLQ